MPDINQAASPMYGQNNTVSIVLIFSSVLASLYLELAHINVIKV